MALQPKESRLGVPEEGLMLREIHNAVWSAERDARNFGRLHRGYALFNIQAGVRMSAVGLARVLRIRSWRSRVQRACESLFSRPPRSGQWRGSRSCLVLELGQPFWSIRHLGGAGRIQQRPWPDGPQLPSRMKALRSIASEVTSRTIRLLGGNILRLANGSHECNQKPRSTAHI